MKILLIVGGKRAGLDLFQSLLDGHPEVLQFPGIIHGNEKLVEILSYDNCSDIAINFIKNYQLFFDSRLNKKERHNMLGENKNQYYHVDKEKFKVHFLKIFKKESKLNTNNKLYENILKLHQAYSLARGEDISKKKNFGNKLSCDFIY